MAVAIDGIAKAVEAVAIDGIDKAKEAITINGPHQHKHHHQHSLFDVGRGLLPCLVLHFLAVCQLLTTDCRGCEFLMDDARVSAIEVFIFIGLHACLELMAGNNMFINGGAPSRQLRVVSVSIDHVGAALSIDCEHPEISEVVAQGLHG